LRKDESQHYIGFTGDKEGRFMARGMEAMELEISRRPNAQRCLLH